MNTSSAKKTIELEANATVPRGASIKLTVEYRIRPPVSTESGPIYEDVSFEKHVDVNMGTNGQYREQAKYRYENETDISTKETTHDTVQTVLKPSHIPKPDDMILVPETIIEHISEDEKSITSEEVVFEEWSEEFRCRRTDEYDPTTKELIRSTIDETSDRIKGDVVKEEYKEKNVRIKGHKSYDVVKQIHRRVPASTLVPIDQVQTHVHEEISSSPQPITSSIIKPMTTTTSSSLQDQQWSTEEVYTTDIVQESYSTNNSGRNTPKIDTSTSNNFNHVRTGRYSPVPATTRANISTTPTTDYNYISEAISPTFKFADKRKEEFVSEEYHIEIETTKDQNETNGQTSPLRRSSDWRNELKQMYSSDNNRYDQYEKQINGNYIPYNNQQRVKEVQIKISTHHRTPSEPRKYEPYLSSKHTVKEVLVRVPQYHRSLLDDYKQKQKKNLYFFETPKKLPSTSTSFENDRLQPSKRSYSSSSILDDNRTQSIQTDRPTLSRIGVLKNTFQSSTNENTKDDTSKYLGAISAGLTEQRRKIFEEQEQANKEWNRRPINGYQSNEYRTNETHTGQSLVSNRISRFENIEAKEISRVQSTERLGRAGIDAIKLSLESSISKASPQTSFDVKMNNNKQIISSIDSDFMGPSQPIYQSTPKSIKQTYHEDQGRDSEDELSEPKQNYDTQQQQYLSKTRFRDFSQSTSPSLDTTHLIERTRFNEKSMENVLSHVPASRGKGVLIELSPTTYQTQTKSIYERNKPDITLDSGVFDRTTTTTTYQLPTSPASWRNNVSTSINDDGLHTNNNSIYIATAATRSNSPYPQRPITDTDDSLTRSTYKYNSEMFSNEPRNQQQQQRNVRRQVTQSAKTDYENPMNYRNNFDTQTKVPLTTQSRSVKPYVVDEIETIETETQVECQVQRTHETNESTKTERAASPIHSPNKIRSKSSYNLSDERTPAKRVFIQERPQYYESTRFNRSLVQNEEDITNRPSRLNSQTYRTNPNGLQLTSLSSQTHVTFDQNPSNEIIATVRIPELSNNRTIRHDRSKSEDDLYQNINGTGYRSSPTIQSYQQQLRSRVGATESTNNRSSPLNYSTQPTSSSSYQSTSYDQNRQQKQRSYSPDPGLTLRSQTQYHSRSLGNLDFEIEIEKRPPHESEQPTVVSLDQSSRAIVTTSKDGRVSIQNIAARPGNTVTINSDFHASDRSLNRSSGYFSSDEIRSQGHNTNYSSDEQSSGINLNSQSPSQRRQRNKSNDKSYHFDRLNNIVNQYSQSSNTSLGFNETIDQIDALYQNLDVETADRSYDFSKSNSRKQIELNPNEYPQRLTSVGFQHIPYEQQTSSTVNANVNNNNNNNNQKWTSSSINNIFTSTPIRPTQSASGGFSTPNSKYSSIQNMILHQNRFNPQSQIVQRNRASVKQVKQKNAARKRNTQEPYSDDDDDNDLSLRINASLHQRPQSSSRSYTYNN
ncbi:unnamed protein product [Adineta steineri]|uniref:Uncharacterized protein n=1 Tax=Adineta steineri TaxID=433720 RepID=A0A819RSL5_9BILA|nr:unnamed protein product [Adineta steineri]